MHVESGGVWAIDRQGRRDRRADGIMSRLGGDGEGGAEPSVIDLRVLFVDLF